MPTASLSSDTRVLALHAGYACAHSGRCCTSGWPIPIEPAARAVVERHLAQATLAPAVDDTAPLLRHEQGVLLNTHDDRCVFYDAAPGGSCRIQRACGVSALPVACQQFPRHVVRDPRGVSITLSHACPTAFGRAAARPQALALITNDAAFPPDAPYIGLDATTALPPALRSRWLLEWETWWAIEAQALTWLAEDARVALPRVRALLTTLVSLAAPSVEDCRVIARAVEAQPLAPWAADSEEGARVAEGVLDTVPETWRAEAAHALRPGSQPVTQPIWTMEVAAHAFASWAAYAGASVWSWLASLEDVARLVERTGSAGEVDLVVRHLADSSALIEHWNRQATRRYSAAMNG